MLEADINPILFSYIHLSACFAASRKAWFLAKARSRASGLQVTVPPALSSFRDLTFSRHRTAEKHPWCFHMKCPLLSPLLYLFITRWWKGGLLGWLPWEGTEAVSPRENSLPDLSPYYRNAWRPTKLFLLWFQRLATGAMCGGSR